ncbi:MAG: HAD family hydrolase [Pseudomonadota bacterium]|nr:HAD family hydrolase [Pseudomonadota bacterium]
MTAGLLRDLPRPRTVLFDWDNTLVDVWPLLHRAMNAALQAVGYAPWTLGEAQVRMKRSARDIMPQLFGDRASVAEKAFHAAYRSLHLEALAPCDGAERILALLHESEIPAAVVSNKTGSILRDEVAMLGWERYFVRTVGARDAARDKPAVDVVLMALESTGIAPGPDVWFVGDTDVDMECAHTSGCTPILLGVEKMAGGMELWPPAAYIPDCNRLHGEMVARLAAP